MKLLVALAALLIIVIVYLYKRDKHEGQPIGTGGTGGGRDNDGRPPRTE